MCKDLGIRYNIPPRKSKATIPTGIIEERKEEDDMEQFDTSNRDDDWDEVEDWEMLGLDPDTPQDEIDQMWENQM